MNIININNNNILNMDIININSKKISIFNIIHINRKRKDTLGPNLGPSHVRVGSYRSNTPELTSPPPLFFFRWHSSNRKTQLPISRSNQLPSLWSYCSWSKTNCTANKVPKGLLRLFSTCRYPCCMW